MKAIQLGEQRYKDGKWWVVKMTPSGVLDWRVRDKGKRKTFKKKPFKTKHFPRSPKNLEFVKDLGGSTGAQLVRDKNTGSEYVMKQGDSKQHIEEEYLTNSIYRLMGVNTPNMKLYKGKDKSFTLAEYMPNVVPANNIMDEQLAEDIAKNFVLDCFLANWDIYKNDNILVDTDTGEFVRVDNGGSLRFSAQGRDKGVAFGDEVDELHSMMEHNPEIVKSLNPSKIKAQINRILTRGDRIIGMIKDDELKEKMYNRLQDLRDEISDEPRSPNRKLKERELQKCLSKAGHIMATNDKQGWVFLSEVCKLREFDQTPEVVDDKEFEKTLKEDKDCLMINRGLTGYAGKTAKDFMKDFIENDDCFYGTMAMYGAGIYGAVNSKKVNPPPSNDDYAIALDYAAGQKEHVLDCILPSDAKIITADKIEEMMNEEFFGEEFKDKKKEYDTAQEEYNNLFVSKEKIEKEVELDVKNKWGWNEKVFQILRKSRPEEVYADPNKFGMEKAVRYFKPLVAALNGNMTQLDDNTYEVKLPNRSETFILNSDIYRRSLKQKNKATTPYNFHYQRLKEFIMDKHYNHIRGKVQVAIDEANKKDPNIKKINAKITESKTKVDAISKEVESLKQNGSATITKTMGEILKYPQGTHRGFYAAIKGYDAIIQKRGWGTPTDFAIILNRSKLKVRKFD